jgi:hypothetical protein
MNYVVWRKEEERGERIARENKNLFGIIYIYF